jgi:hypothetical protein
MNIGKFSSGLINYLGVNKDANVDVIIELSPLPADPDNAHSGKSKMEINKETFYQSSKPVENFIVTHGGNVLGLAWINKTIKANIPAKSLQELARYDIIAAIDLPEKIKRD